VLIALDTTFFAIHYFSREAETLSKTKKILHLCRKLGNKGIVPTIVLAEFYALTHKRAGKDLAEKYFNEIVKSRDEQDCSAFRDPSLQHPVQPLDSGGRPLQIRHTTILQ
jgi:predicted nucleic acid-binding protein